MTGPDPGSPLLSIWLEGQLLRTIPLGDGPVTVGRLPDNGVVLADQSVSRRHAELRLDADGLLVTDLGSAGGTFVGTEPLLPSRPVVVPQGDPIRIGPFVLTWATQSIRIEIAAKAAPPPSPPESWTPPTRASEAFVVPIEAREQYPVPTALGPTSRYLYDLPSIFQDDGAGTNGNGKVDMSTNDRPPPFLGRMLLIYESLWEPLEQRQNAIAMYYDPRTCPAEFLSWLASWLQLAIDRHWPEPRRRRLLREAMELYLWRGTPYGLTRMIEVCTGITPVITENDAQPYTFQIRVKIPPKSDARPEFIEYLVAAHKPAHVGYILEFAA